VTTDQQQPQAEQIAYLPWYEAGGPNECEHGYADGIPCPHCDQNPKLQALVATVARQAEQIGRLTRVAEATKTSSQLEHEYWLHDRDCKECHRVRHLGQACMEQVERFERLWNANEKALTALAALEPGQ
jgi:hypothetical protein